MKPSSQIKNRLNRTRKTIQTKKNKQNISLSSKIPLVFKSKDVVYVLTLAVDSRMNCKVVEVLADGNSIDVEKLIQRLGEAWLEKQVGKALTNSRRKRKEDGFRLSY